MKLVIEFKWKQVGMVDALSLHPYITKCKAHEAIVKENQRRENGDEGPLKRVTRSGARTFTTSFSRT